jgi:hypothetical protein
MPRLLSSSAFVLMCALSTHAQDTESTAQETEVELPDLATIQKQVEEIRGLPFIADVPAEQQSMEDFQKMIMEEIEKEYGDPQEFVDIVDGLMRLGMLKERIDLDEAFVNAIASQAAAYYDPESGKFFYLYTDMPMEQLNTFAAHELVHALQDQHFDLDAIQEELLAAGSDDEGPRNDDYILAVRCLIEGEATYVMNIFSLGEEAGNMTTDMMGKLPMEQLTALSQMAAEMSDDLAEAVESMDELPAYILEPLYAAYMSGAGFAKHLRTDGGWAGVAAAWANRPLSTELCLHPEKYVNDEVDLPTTIMLPELPYLEEAGWKRIDSAIHGEFYLNMLLRHNGVSESDARRATLGWDGDVYGAWRNEAGDVAIILATTWDRERDAEQFFEAYLLACEAKYLATTIPDPEDEAFVSFECGGGEGMARIVHAGLEVHAIEGFSEELTARIAGDLASLSIERVGTVPRDEAFPNQPAADPIGAPVDAEDVSLDAFAFTPDAQWQRVEPSSQMRLVQYSLPAVEGDREAAELVIFFFGDGHGGTYEANRDRWTGQFAESIEPVERTVTTEGGITIRTFDIAGRYVAETAPGSGERHDKPNFRMITAVFETDRGGPFYFKAVGPRATMDHWEDSIRAMLESMRAAE